jgi:drug/metabolite transporter (DMT)-like permease
MTQSMLFLMFLTPDSIRVIFDKKLRVEIFKKFPKFWKILILAMICFGSALIFVGSLSLASGTTVTCIGNTIGIFTFVFSIIFLKYPCTILSSLAMVFTIIGVGLTALKPAESISHDSVKDTLLGNFFLHSFRV